ncbi:MAG: DUF2007 domain-containing protein [Candidatus Schekmanbacteria bacterium]|nr:DUF2007 domain-containing protein [Candidatus Schekmanbacteria bacterium]
MDHHYKDMVEIFNTTEESEFLVLKSLLESEGISLECQSNKVPQFPVNIDGLGLIRIFVKKEDAVRARNILKAEFNKKLSKND